MKDSALNNGDYKPHPKARPHPDEHLLKKLAKALNIPYRTTAGPFNGYCTLPTDLEELEEILRKHYRK